MTNMTKEEVIGALEVALLQKEGRAIKIEQKGSWYKIEDGKSLRFSELEAMLASLSTAVISTAKSPVTQKKVEADKTVTEAKTIKPAQAAPAVKQGNNGGKTPKQLWREKLTSQKGKYTLPRGF
jgi:hypothetical protein